MISSFSTSILNIIVFTWSYALLNRSTSKEKNEALFTIFLQNPPVIIFTEKAKRYEKDLTKSMTGIFGIQKNQWRALLCTMYLLRLRLKWLSISQRRGKGGKKENRRIRRNTAVFISSCRWSFSVNSSVICPWQEH